MCIFWRGGGVGGQEGRVQRIQVHGEEGQHQMLVHFLQEGRNNPRMYCAPRTQYLRDFFSLVERNPGTFRSMDNDNTIEIPVAATEHNNQLTNCYVSALAELRERRFISKRPHFSVATVEVKKVTDPKRQKERVHITQGRLVDGDDCQIHCQLAPHIMALGRNLKRRDIICLDNFTELRHHVNEASPKMPALFIHAFARVGYRELPDIVQGNCNLHA